MIETNCNTENYEKQAFSDKILSHAERRQRKFLLKAHRMVSVAVAKGLRLRWFVLTQSDASLASGADFMHEFHKFIIWLRYQCPDFQYMAVEHEQGNELYCLLSDRSVHKRKNWHILSYGSDKLPCRAMSDYWQEHYLSNVTGMEEVKSPEKAIRYVADYLKADGKFIKSWQSHGAVFDGWLGMSKRYFSNYSEYPTSDEIVYLATLSTELRAELVPSELMHGNSSLRKAKSRTSPVACARAKPGKARPKVLDERALQPIINT